MMVVTNQSTSNKNQGFTLIELMIAMAVGGDSFGGGHDFFSIAA